jgi:hypothetical protein
VKKTLFVLFAMLLVAAVFAGCGATAAPAAPASLSTLPADISVQAAAKLRDAGAFVLDVREPAEWNQVHIPGATLIPLGELRTRANKCRKTNRSS